METLFNSSFLETAVPSELTDMLNTLGLAPYIPKHVSGTSYPVKLNISGDTRFYDYKIADNIDLGGLIEENLSSVANSLGVTIDGKEVDIDTIFPLKRLIADRASVLGAVKAESGGARYVNVPIAFYGGGLNLSEVTMNDYDNKSSFSAQVDVDLLDSCLSYKQSGGSSGQASQLKAMALKAVVTVTGYEPFSFRFVKDGYLYGETPHVTDLIANNKGE